MSGAGAYTNGTIAGAASPEARVSDSVVDTSQSDPQSSSKKSRSKACEDCRKSKVGKQVNGPTPLTDSTKRRCVHDQYGRIDPAKVAEPSKPRGSSNAKRTGRLSDDDRMDDNFEDMIDPALMNGDTSHLGNYASEEDFHTPGPFSGDRFDQPEQTDRDAPMANGCISENAIDPSLDDSALIKTEQDSSTIVVHSTSVNHSSALSTPAPVRNATSINGDYSGGYGWTPGSRQSSRQPKHVERFTPEDKRSPSKPFPKSQVDRRASSAASAQTVMTSIKSERSSSNTSGTTHQMAGLLASSRRSGSRDGDARPGSRGSGAGTEADADELFARQLQAAENGLRHRASVRS